MFVGVMRGCLDLQPFVTIRESPSVCNGIYLPGIRQQIWKYVDTDEIPQNEISLDRKMHKYQCVPKNLQYFSDSPKQICDKIDHKINGKVGGKNWRKNR